MYSVTSWHNQTSQMICVHTQETDTDASREAGSALAGATEEAIARAPLVVATLKALCALSNEAFRRHLLEVFPLLTGLISCIRAPPEVQRSLSDLFAKRIGPLLG